ncbi:MAG: hypothetical protein PVH88_16805 [Ignavibacteria bacterium]|jgi:hypothetical protein
MLSKENLLKKFETEMWLYLDGSLPEDQMNFWDKKINDSPELKNMLDETNKVLELYDNYSEAEPDSKYYKKVIEKTLSQKTLTERIESLFNIKKKKTSRDNGLLKIAFGSVLIVASIIILMISKSPNPVKNISTELLEWDPDEITEQIRDAENTFSFIKNDEAKKYIIQKISNDEWSRDVYQIGSKIKQLNKEVNVNEF